MINKLAVCFTLMFLIMGCDASALGEHSRPEIKSFEEAELLRYEAENSLDMNFKEKKYQEAKPIYEYLAENGDPMAQFILGDIYDRALTGQGDHEKGFYWTKKAADNGNIDAILNTAMNYAMGTGTAVNLVQAKKYYQIGADKNDPKAQYLLGSTLIDEDDISNGLRYLKDAANNGNDLAQFQLGLIYCDGEIVKKDYQQCNDYWKESADQGNRDAQFNYAVNMHQGFGKYNIDEAIKYYMIASAQGNGSASYNLHAIYNNPKHNRIDKVKASNYLKMAEEQGYNRPKAIMYIKEE